MVSVTVNQLEYQFQFTSSLNTKHLASFCSSTCYSPSFSFSFPFFFFFFFPSFSFIAILNWVIYRLHAYLAWIARLPFRIVLESQYTSIQLYRFDSDTMRHKNPMFDRKFNRSFYIQLMLCVSMKFQKAVLWIIIIYRLWKSLVLIVISTLQPILVEFW